MISQDKNADHSNHVWTQTKQYFPNHKKDQTPAYFVSVAAAPLPTVALVSL